jgi:CheY-like chemotaxis protein
LAGKHHRGERLSLAGTRVFIVEDEALVLMVLEDSLTGLGCDVVASALYLDEALAKAGEHSFDVAILDANLGGPVADLLAGRGIPFIFASGYGPLSLPESHRERPLLAKPFAAAELRAALLEVVPPVRPASR